MAEMSYMPLPQKEICVEWARNHLELYPNLEDWILIGWSDEIHLLVISVANTKKVTYKRGICYNYDCIQYKARTTCMKKKQYSEKNEQVQQLHC